MKNLSYKREGVVKKNYKRRSRAIHLALHTLVGAGNSKVWLCVFTILLLINNLENCFDIFNVVAVTGLR